MASALTNAHFLVWCADLATHGPLELPALVSWVKGGRVSAGTWIFVAGTNEWQRAADVPQLQLFFQCKVRQAPSTEDGAAAPNDLDPRALRRIKLLSTFNDQQLERFARFMEVERVPQSTIVVRQGERGDSMYIIVQGELCVRMKVAGLETTLATLGVGDFFGDISLFDHGPRSADVVARSSSTLLKISSTAFAQFVKAAPEMATPFLLAIGRTLTARIRAGNKHRGESVKLSRALEPEYQ